MKLNQQLRVWAAIYVTLLVLWTATGATRAAGPLRVHPQNPRYFTDGTKNADGSLKVIYLTGSHTWANLIDRGPSDPPPVFDFDGYLDLLQKHHHNFIRLWGRHVSWYHGYGEQELHAGPLAWSRTGPGNALDGKPRFDLMKLNQAYFDRLRARVSAARDRGIYVGIMLFGGTYECRGGWRGNPFNVQNNINGVNGDPSGDGEGPESHTLEVAAVTRLQESYVRKVIDTVNDLDNVLYEISNEGEDSSREWQYHLIRFIHDYEASKPKQHPVGMTAIGSGDAESNKVLSASPAEWISPHTHAWGGLSDIPAADGKVSLLDSDHWFVVELYKNPTLGRQWVWKSFCRGHNSILMEHLPPQSMVLRNCPLTPDDPGYIASREAMGHTRRLAERMNLAAMTPSRDLTSSGYCLANPGKEYLVYLPEGGTVTVDLSGASGQLRLEWMSPITGAVTSIGNAVGGGHRSFKAPFEGEAVLYINVAPAQRPLRVHPENRRYFTDGTKMPDGSLRAVYLTGSHHWHNLQDAGRLGGPLTKRFDYDGYLELLTRLNHNFVRMWAWEGGAWWWQGGENDEYYTPIAYSRAAPGTTSDGKPKYDLNLFNPEYFARLRSRVIAAKDRGIYVSVMLFQGWSIYSHGYGNPWPLHPFNEANNINGVDGDPDKDGEGREVHTLQVPAVTRLQEAYVRKVIDTLNDLDNVLYEITNESAIFSKDWQYHIVRFIKEYQATKSKQHPVGITAFDSGREGSMLDLLESPADWISPQNDGVSGDYLNDPPVADGRKVIVSDTDHLWGVGGDSTWVWKSFARGHHPIYMDPLRKQDWFSTSEAEMEGARKAMGDTRRFAERMNLAAIVPHNELSSTRYCLAAPGKEYLVFQPKSGEAFSVELEPGTYRYEWFNPARGEDTGSSNVQAAGGRQQFKAPFAGDAVLYLRVK